MHIKEKISWCITICLVWMCLLLIACGNASQQMDDAEEPILPTKPAETTHKPDLSDVPDWFAWLPSPPNALLINMEGDELHSWAIKFNRLYYHNSKRYRYVIFPLEDIDDPPLVRVYGATHLIICLRDPVSKLEPTLALAAYAEGIMWRALTHESKIGDYSDHRVEITFREKSPESRGAPENFGNLTQTLILEPDRVHLRFLGKTIEGIPLRIYQTDRGIYHLDDQIMSYRETRTQANTDFQRSLVHWLNDGVHYLGIDPVEDRMTFPEWFSVQLERQ